MFIITPDETVVELTETRFFPDAFTGATYDLSWSAPSKPVANGFVKSQGIFKNLNRLTLSGCVAGVALNKQGVDPFEGAADRTVAACNLIEAMGDAADCVTVNMGEGKIFENMALIAAPIRFEVGGVMTFDLAFQEIRPFDLSATFDATLDQAVNIGEVATTTATPLRLPEGANDEALERFATNPFQFNECETICGVANQFCLDDCYGDIL